MSVGARAVRQNTTRDSKVARQTTTSSLSNIKSLETSAPTLGNCFPDTAVFPGDVNCSGTTDAIDSLQILSFAAGLTTTAADCLQQYGNVNCDASINAIDSMLVLRYAADLPIDLTQGCPAIGGPPTVEALTHALNTATTAGDADWVLKLIYQQLGLAVYTKDGQLVQEGTQTGAEDFYFYDFESELLARNYVARQLSGLDTAALFLNEAGVLNGGSGRRTG